MHVIGAGLQGAPSDGSLARANVVGGGGSEDGDVVGKRRREASGEKAAEATATKPELRPIPPELLH